MTTSTKVEYKKQTAVHKYFECAGTGTDMCVCKICKNTIKMPAVSPLSYGP